MAVALLVAIAVVAPAAPAHSDHRPAPPQPSPLQVVPDLLSAVLPGLLAPEAPTALAPSVRDRVATSTVRVSGPACGGVQIGTGFSAGVDTAVTAAHVVAGMSRPEVLRPDGRRLPATVVAFDSNKDLAVLRVNGLGQPPLPLGQAAVGTNGAVFGHPNGQTRVEVSPAKVVAQGTVPVDDIYSRTRVPRAVLRLSSRLDPGDSGGPVVDSAGRVVGVAFGISVLRRDVAFATSSRELQPLLSQPLTSPVSTGPCLDN